MKCPFPTVTMMTLFVVTMLCLLSMTSHAQNLYGTSGSNTDEYFHRVFPYSQGFYVLGVENNVAYISHLDLNGDWDWTSRLNLPSLLTDARVIPGSNDLLFIGLTLTGSSNQSIIGQIDRFGLIGCLNILESPGSEGLIRMDANPGGSYTVVGFQTDPITLQDVVILDISPNCVINSKRIFLSSVFDEFGNDVEVIGTDFYVAGIVGNAANIYRTSLAGTFVGGVRNPVQYSYNDIEEANGDLLAIANPTGAGQPRIIRFDPDLLVLWEISIFGVSRLEHIVENNGDIYVVGTATVAGLSRSVIFRIDDSSGPQIVWAKYIDDSETSFAGGSLAILSGGDIAYVDAREHVNGFGDYDAFFTLTDEDLTTTCTQALTLDFSAEFTLYESPIEIVLEFYDVPPFMGGDAVSLEWDQVQICTPDSCEAAFSFTIVNDCGMVSFTDQSSGTPGLQYCWDFDGNTATCESILPNPTWQFPGPPCQSWLVCLTITAADGCTDTYCNSFTIFDNIPPVINCPPDVTLACDDDVSPITTGFANALDNCTLSPALVYSDIQFGNIPCDGFIEREWTATDDCGNSSTCIQIIMIIDNTPPLLSNCPPDMTINVPGNPLPCQSNVTIPIPVATDYCSLPVTLTNDYNGGADASGLYPAGTTTVTWTATDDCGNTATCSMNVTVTCESMGSQLNLSCGMAVVTCFPGFNNPSNPFTNINNTAPVIAIMDVRNTSGATPGPGFNWAVTKEMFAQGNAQNIGQVFGLAIDNLGRIYTTASTIYGSATNLGAYGFQWGPGGPGGIYRFTYNAGLGQWQMEVFASLPNSGSGLGNIAYDPTKDQFFVTNHSDGLIYRIQNSPSGPGTVYSNKYDFQGTSHFPGSAGFVPLGERLWGIGYHGGRVYFSVWNEDNFRKLTGVSNQIFSIGLDITGEFKANTDQTPEVSLPNYFGDIYSNPVSDIEFSEAGSMIVAEKVMLADFGDVTSTTPGNLAHRARIFQYRRVGPTWGSPMHIQIGNAQVTPPTQHNNSAGGVDYGYQDLDNFGGLVGCDSIIWGTGDALMFTGHNQYANNNDRVYGLAAMPSRGNTANPSGPDWVESSSFYVDLDGQLGSEEKTEIGDVDIWNCICPGTNLFCDSIEVTSTPSTIPNDTCCFVLEVNNQLNNFFTGITLCSSNGVSISSISALNGWNIVGYTSQQVTLQPSTQYVSTTSHDFFRFCLSNYQAVTNQQVIVKYHGPNFSVECMDTLNYQCSEKPKCIKIVNDTVTCADNGTYEMDFCIMSDALIGWPVSAIQLNPPAGITFTPSVFSVVPSLTPGGMRCTFTTQISGAQDGQTVCFSVTAHKQNIANGETPLDCCTDTVMQACVTMPTCKCNNVFATYTSGLCGGDTCCWNVTLTNNYSNSYFTGVNLDILTPGVVFGAICNTLGSGWGLNSGSTDATFTKLPSGSYLGASETLPTFCLAGITSASQVPQEVALYWLGPNGDTACADTLLFYCEPPVESDCAVIVNPKITCDSITGGYLFEFQVQNNSGFTVDQVSLNLIQPLGSIFPDQFNLTTPLPHTQTSPVLTTSMYGPAGSQICFNLTVHDLGPNGLELNCCTRSQQYCYVLPPCDTCVCHSNLTISSGNAQFPVFCFPHLGFIPSFGCPADTVIISGFFGCGDSTTWEPCEETEVQWTLFGPDNTPIDGGLTSNYTVWLFPPSLVGAPGPYSLTLWTFCPGSTDTCICVVSWVQEPCNTCTCPGSGVSAPNLVMNGDFSLGDTGFTSGQVGPGSGNPCVCTDGTYCVSTNFTNKCTGWPSVSDHTGDLAANFLIVDGNDGSPGSLNVWSQSVNIQPCMTYCFSFWTASVYNTPFNLNVVVYDVAGNPVSPLFGSVSIIQTTPPWSQQSFTWTAPCNASGPFTIAINQVVGDSDTDFGIDDICLTKIETPPDSCECGTLEWAEVYGISPLPQPISCDTTALIIPCRKFGSEFFIHGNLTCASDTCGPDVVSWILDRPGNLADASGIAIAPYPHFDIGIPWSHFSQGGSYTLTVTRNCGSKQCSCKFKFIVETCPCGCDDLKDDVDKGFVAKGNKNSCSRKFKPIALCPSDVVTWHVNGPGLNQSFGPTTGNGTILVTFPPPGGTYSVCMFVTRIDPLTGDTCMWEYCRNVIVKCKPTFPNDTVPHITLCPGGERLRNGDFTEDLWVGHLGSGGGIEEWEIFPNPGRGIVLIDSSGSSDDGQVVLIGGKDNFAGITQHMRMNGDVVFIGMYINNYLGDLLPAGTVLEFRIQDEPIQGSPTHFIYRHELNTSVVGWTEISIEAPIDIAYGSYSLVICVQNDSEGLLSTIGIDNVELCTDRNVGTTGNWISQDIRVFPNPNNGDFTVDLSELTVSGKSLRVVDLTGQLVSEQEIENSNPLQTVNATNLPEGMYILQIISESRVTAVSKFVKM